MLTRLTHRRSEEGQVLILGIIFIAFFGVVIGAVLQFANTVSLQHVHTENTATSDSNSEGGAAYLAANAARLNQSSWKCDGTDHGTLTMSDGSAVSYSVPDCNPGNTTTTTSTAGQCLLCILNLLPATTPAAGTPVLIAQCASGSGCTTALQTIGGDDYLNGSIAGNTTFNACTGITVCTGPSNIYVLPGATYPAGCCTPGPATTSTFQTPLSDPLQSIGYPSGAGEPNNCVSNDTTTSPVTKGIGGTWDPGKGCIANGAAALSKHTANSTVDYTLEPGVYNNLSIGGQANVLLRAGVYVFTGALQVQGQANVCASGTITGNDTVGYACSAAPGVTLYATCTGTEPTGPAYQRCASGGQTGATLSFSGRGQLRITAPPCPSGEIVPNCPGYDGVAILADPHLIDPGGVASSLTTTACNTSGSGCVLSVAGLGGSINGSVDTRSGGVSVSGNGGDSISSGFLIANSLFISDSGRAASGLSLSGPGSLASVSSCTVLDANVGPGSTPPANGPRAIAELPCGTTDTSGIVAFNYLP